MKSALVVTVCSAIRHPASGEAGGIAVDDAIVREIGHAAATPGCIPPTTLTSATLRQRSGVRLIPAD
jgi:hypothetical protein